MPDQLLSWLIVEIGKIDLKHVLWNVWIGSYDHAKGRQSLFGFCLFFARYIPVDAIYSCKCDISLQVRDTRQVRHTGKRLPCLYGQVYVPLRSAWNACCWYRAVCRSTGSGQRMLCTAQGAAYLYDLYKKSENYKKHSEL